MTTNNNDNNNDLNAGNSNIIFESSDFNKSVELLLFEQDNGKRFQIHMWNADTDQSMALNISREELCNLVDILYPYIEVLDRDCGKELDTTTI